MDDIKQGVEAEMENPIREFFDSDTNDKPTWSMLRQWEDDFDSLLNPWVSADKIPTKGEYLGFIEGRIDKVAFDGRFWWVKNNYGTTVCGPSHYMPLPSPPSKGGE